MCQQLTFISLALAAQKKCARGKILPAKIDQFIPWTQRREAVIDPF